MYTLSVSPVVNSVPALVERFFPSEDSNHYRVAILDRLDTRVFERGLVAGETLDQRHFDAMAHFFTGARSEFSARMLAESRMLAWQMEMPRHTAGANVSVFVQESGPGVSAQPTRINFSGWRIALQHGAGVGLIVINARKSEKLAAQQMEFVATVSHELRRPNATAT